MAFKKQNASGPGGASITKLAGYVMGQNLFDCSADHISKLCRELHLNGCGLCIAHAQTQVTTLLKALTHLGPRGLNTYEGTAAGYARLATRIQDLEDAGWLILSQRENLIGPDRLYHAGVARYILIGRRGDLTSPQGQLDLEVAPCAT